MIIDVLGNYDQVEYIQTNNLKDCILEIKKYYLLTKKNKKWNSPEVPKVISLKTHDPVQAADYVSACIWEINGGTLVLDEVDSISIKEGSCFDEYIRYGRNHNGDLITGCRRPAELERNITAAANKFYCFQTHEWRDIEYFDANVFGDRAQELQRMEKWTGMFLDYDAGLIGKFRIDRQGKIYHIEESVLT